MSCDRHQLVEGLLEKISQVGSQLGGGEQGAICKLAGRSQLLFTCLTCMGKTHVDVGLRLNAGADLEGS